MRCVCILKERLLTTIFEPVLSCTESSYRSSLICNRVRWS